MAQQPTPPTSPAPQPKRRVFFAYDMSDETTRMILADLHKHQAPNWDIHVAGLGGKLDDLWSVVKDEIEAADVVVGIVDLPNANVAFELGYALARGKEVLLLTVNEGEVPWTKLAPFKNILRGSGGDWEQILNCLGKSGLQLKQEPPARGPKTLFLCPDHRLGKSVRRGLAELQPAIAHHHLQALDGWNITELAQQFKDAWRVVWVVLDFDPAKDQRDGQHNAAAAAIAGLAKGFGLLLRVWRQANAREIVDVGSEAIKFNDVEPLLIQLQDSAERDRRLLEEYLQSPPVLGKPSVATPTDTLGYYRRWVQRQHQTIVPFFGLATRSLQEVHVERRVELANGSGRMSNDGWELRGGFETLSGLIAAGARNAVDPSKHKDKHPAQEDNKDERPRSAATLVLLGEPGAGKTTSLRQLAQELASKPDGPLPLFLSLSRWANASVKDDPIALLAETCAGCGGGIEAEALKAALRQAREPGGPGLILLLDGLDEVVPDQQRQLLERIKHLLREWPEVPLVLSSRLTGYPGKPSDEFLECRLSPLDSRRQRELLTHWLGASQVDAALARIAERVRLAELSSNPLLLTLLAKLFQGSPDKPLPTTRGKLYQAAIKVLLEQGHGIDRSGMEHPDSARKLLRPLAWSLLRAGGSAWSREQINDLLLTEAELNPAVGTNLWVNFGGSDPFLQQVRQRGGVLGDHDGEGQPWRFLHRSLGEQLAAEAMAATNSWTPATLLQDLASDGGLDRWGETISLLTGLLNLNDPRRAQLLQAIARHSHNLATRLLPQLEGLGIDEAWTLLEQVPLDKDVYAPYPWDGVDLASLLRSLAADGHPIDVLEASLMQRAKLLFPSAKPSHRDQRLERAAHLLFALEQLHTLHAVEPRPNPLQLPAAVQAATQRFFQEVGIHPPETQWIPRAIRVPTAGLTVTFRMGSDENVGNDDERPLREVTLSAFALSIAPVTEAQFSRLEGTPPSRGKEDHPVTCVSWWHAWLYCRWVGGQLPSEAQWECAARAGTYTLWPNGNTPEGLELEAWFIGGKGKGSLRAHPVAQLRANPWGFHDLLGNVLEWCADFYGPYDPDKCEDPTGPSTGDVRVLRGGSAAYAAEFCRPGQRSGFWPGYLDGFRGFRVAFPFS